MVRDIRRVVLTLVVSAVAFICVVTSPARAQTVEPDGQQLRVYLMTVEAGTQIFEKFGHDALWIVDAQTGQGLSYNYGIFEMDAPGFMLNFLRGRMNYSMNPGGPIPTDWELNRYASDNRTVWLQELNMTPAQKVTLRDFLNWNNLPQNMVYKYDYFRDNCTTRLRDAIDRALGGQLRAALEPKDAGTTYRWQARRLLSVSEPAYAGIELAMGHPVDVALTHWSDAFLPTKLMEYLNTVQVRAADGAMAPLVLSTVVAYQSTRDPMPAAPPNRTIPYLLVSVLVGVAFILLARIATARNSRAARVAYVLATSSWSLLVGFFGLVSLLLWVATDHTITRTNENILQANVLSLILAVVLAIAILTGRGRRAAFRLAAAAAFLSALGFVLQVLPGFDQFNGEIIALLLPAHLALLASIRDFRRVIPSLSGDTRPV